MKNYLTEIPKGFLEASPTELYKIVGDLTLIHLKGRDAKPLFLGCLAHGNEYTGLLVIQELLKKYQNQEFPRDLIILVNNVTAARHSRRHLDDQPDYNRIWEEGDSQECKMALGVLSKIKEFDLFASIDIHNNTGRNPHYSCITSKDMPSRNLAKMFSPISLYFEVPTSALTSVMSRLCPSVTLEAGLPGVPDGTAHVLEFVEAVWHLKEVPHEPVSQQDLKVFCIAAAVKLPEEYSVGFGDDHLDADVVFIKDFDLYNFKEIPDQTVLGRIKNGHKLLAIDNNGKNIVDEFFIFSGNQIVNQVPLTLSMITLDSKIAKSDCVGYVMGLFDV